MIMILMYWLLNYRITWHIHRNVIDQERKNLFSQKQFVSLSVYSTDTLISVQKIIIRFSPPQTVYMILQVSQFYKQQSRNGCLTYFVTLVIQSNSCTIHTLKHTHFNI